MFESVKHWFESLKQESHLFDHPEDAVIHAALASVLMHIITSDHKESHREFEFFANIMKDEFQLDDEQIDELYDIAKQANSDLTADLTVIKQHLKDNSNIRMRFMEKLNRLIDIDGVMDSEMTAFYEALHVIFPDIKVNE